MDADGDANEDDFLKQTEEAEALSSIYEGDVKIISFPKHFEIKIKEEALNVTLEVHFPNDYPTKSPPTYNIQAPFLKGEKRQALSYEMNSIYIENIGESIVYLWVEAIRDFLSANNENEKRENQASTVSDCFEPVDFSSKFDDSTDQTNAELPLPHITSGEIITDRRSHFQAHLAPVDSVAQINLVLEELKKNRKIANAAHNTYAYRFFKGSVLCQDCDDDGETHAGGRVLHLLQILDAQNVLVVVSRWFGGIKLGPDRFKHINNAARQVLQHCNYITRTSKEQKQNPRKSKKKS